MRFQDGSMSVYFMRSLLLLGISGFAFEATSTGQALHPTQQNMPSSGDAILTSNQKSVFNSQSLLILFSSQQTEDDSIIEEANRIFDTITSTSVDLDYTITPDMAYFKFLAKNFSFFRSRSTQWDNGIYDYRLPTSGYLHLKTFRFVVDSVDQKLRFVVAMSSFL
jgi:hypothetical protein